MTEYGRKPYIGKTSYTDMMKRKTNFAKTFQHSDGIKPYKDKDGVNQNYQASEHFWQGYQVPFPYTPDYLDDTTLAIKRHQYNMSIEDGFSMDDALIRATYRMFYQCYSDQYIPFDTSLEVIPEVLTEYSFVGEDTFDDDREFLQEIFTETITAREWDVVSTVEQSPAIGGEPASWRKTAWHKETFTNYWAMEVGGDIFHGHTFTTTGNYRHRVNGKGTGLYTAYWKMGEDPEPTLPPTDGSWEYDKPPYPWAMVDAPAFLYPPTPACPNYINEKFYYGFGFMGDNVVKIDDDNYIAMYDVGYDITIGEVAYGGEIIWTEETSKHYGYIDIDGTETYLGTIDIDWITNIYQSDSYTLPNSFNIYKYGERYNTGTAWATTNSNVITSDGDTRWSDYVVSGDKFICEGKEYTVSVVASNSYLTLTENYTGTGGRYLAYEIKGNIRNIYLMWLQRYEIGPGRHDYKPIDTTIHYLDKNIGTLVTKVYPTNEDGDVEITIGSEVYKAADVKISKNFL